METSLSLTVPASDAVEHPTVQTDPGRLGVWIRSLPYADPDAAVTRLGESLRHLNRAPGPVTRRADLMARYEEAFRHLFLIFLRRCLSTRSADPSKRDRRYAELIRELAVEMGYGYKRVIQARRGDRRGGSPAAALLHAMRMLQIDLLFSYARYSRPATSTWRELCTLYGEAERLGIQDQAVDVATETGEAEIRCSALLKRAALIALLDPYRLAPGQIWHADGYLKRWAERAELTTLQTEAAAEGGIVIDLQGAPPRPFDPDGDYEPRSRFLLVDPSPLRHVVESHLEELEDPESRRPSSIETLEPSRAAQLLRQMEHAWFAAARRESPRQERYDWLPVACGLGAVVRQLRRGPGEAALRGLTADPGAVEHAQAVDEAQAGGELPGLRLRQFNRSAGGMGVRVRLPAPAGLSVGQVVLVQEEAGNGGRLLGIVRRMILRDSINAEIGIQFLETDLQPVEIRPLVFDAGRKPDFQPALISDGPDPRHRGMLFTPRHMFKPGREYMVDLRGSNLRVMAERLVESNTGYDRFEYRVSMRDRAV